MGKTVEKQKHEIMLENQIKVSFLYHSGFLVELPEIIFLFDYYKGVIPELDSRKNIYVFSIHRHSYQFCF